MSDNTIDKAQYSHIATCRSRIQTRQLVDLLNEVDGE
jgi:hypothetical protein